MSVRAKFKCESVEDSQAGTKNIRLNAVINGSPENEEFFKWTPSGTLFIGCVNPAANAQFEVGREYYIDITPAN